jgi:DNA repair exonuclease SbcCD ATPase subunit
MTTPPMPPATDPGPATPPVVPTGTGDRFFTQEEVNAAIEKAREQEKNKLYPAMTKADERAAAMEAELKELSAFRKKAEKDEAARLKAIEDAQRTAAEAELSAKELLAKRDEEFNNRLAQIQAENEQRVALMEQEVKFNQLQAYIQRRAAEESATIVPELLDFINGSTPEEVDASIEVLKAKSAAIADAARGARAAQLRQQPGVAPVAGVNGVTPLDQPGDRQLTADDIRGMSMQEFAALRKKINMPSGSGRGLFD